ncbi:MAG: NAD(P)H-dependent glycerol-3-phosphate dehydrogenase [Actinomycetota bacterium]
MPIRVAVVGAGSWGTTVASLASRNAPTQLWARSKELAEQINGEHRNGQYLSAYELPDALVATSDLEEAVANADVVVMGVPSHGFRDVLTEAAAHVRPWVPVVSLTKGLEQQTMLRMTEVIGELLPGHPAGVLTGPNLAKEIMAGHPAASVVAMADPVISLELQRIFSTDIFRVYTNPDVTGCELGGTLKNVMAIAAGMADGMGFGDNTRAALITRGLAELTRLGVAMGGDPMTFAGLAGMGDLVATCISTQSRNRGVGEQLGKGRKIDEIIEEMHMVAEGVKSSKTVLDLGERHGVEMPIAAAVASVIHDGATAADAMLALLSRQAKSELQGLR